LYDPFYLFFNNPQFLYDTDNVAVHGAITSPSVLKKNAIDVILLGSL